jgi:DNA-binding NarL/FixJ family response regulator
MKTIDILVADDHAIIRNGLRNILADTDDLRVAGEAGNGNALLDKLRERDWDLLLLDLSMPGRHGLELLKLVKAERPHLPVLIFTMHQEEQYAVRTIRAGASGYLTKESDGEVLLAAIRKVASGGFFLSPRVAELLADDVSKPHNAPAHTLLSDREFEVLARIVAGRSLTEIAAELGLSIKTVSTHKSHILDKLQISNQVELVRYAIHHGLIEGSPQ